MKKTTNQQGFAALEIVLFVVVIAFVAGVSFYVYKANNKATDTYNQASSSSAAPVVTTKKTTDTKKPATTTPTTSTDTTKSN